MPQFDVHRLRSGIGLVIDCQSNLLKDLDTRFVIPLLPVERAPKPARRLNPLLRIDGLDFVLTTQFASTVQKSELGDVVLSCRDRSFEIVRAIDVLISGV